jgi:hypothetical protein
LGPLHHPHAQIGDLLEPVSKALQRFAFSQPGFAGYQSKAALGGHSLNAQGKMLGSRDRIQRIGRQIG